MFLLPLLFTIIALSGHAVSSSVPPKNILLILTDDQGLYDIGYNNPDFNTPTLDSLKENGLNLGKHYSSTSTDDWIKCPESRTW